MTRLHKKTLVLSFDSGWIIASTAQALIRDDIASAKRLLDKLAAKDPVAYTLTPLLLWPWSNDIAIETPWVEPDMRLVLPPPLDIPSHRVQLIELLDAACKAGLRVRLRTRSGVRDEKHESIVDRLLIASMLPRGCLVLDTREPMHEKILEARIGRYVVSTISTANLTASEIWKTRIGYNKSRVEIVDARSALKSG